MNPTILNREFQHPADAWYQIEAKGRHPNRAAGVVQVIDDEAAQSIVNRFNADAQAGTLRHGSEMLIDHEHFSDQPDKETRAYGWLTRLENRADGIYGQIRWTKTGKEAVDGGDYRFFSTEYAPADLKLVNKDAKEVRPTRLDGLTLTNMNNNRGQKPITNREGAEDAALNKDGFVTIDGHVVFIGADKDTTDDGAENISEGAHRITLRKDKSSGEWHYKSAFTHPATKETIWSEGATHLRSLSLKKAQDDKKTNERAHDSWQKAASRRKSKNRQPLSGAVPGMQSTNNPKNRMTTIAAELGLAPEAAEEAVLAEVRKLKNRADTVAGLTTERDALKTANTALEAEQIDGLLAHHKITDEKVLNRLKPVLATMKNRADREAFLTDCVAVAAKPAAPAAGRVLNRGEGKAPAAAAPAADEQELAKQADAEITSYKLKNRCSYSEARNAVRTQKPELFGLTK